PDFVFVEVHLRLNEDLPRGAPGNLLQVAAPFDGLVYFFEMVDPENRLVNHAFAFHILVRADEETLLVADGRYLRQSAVLRLFPSRRLGAGIRFAIPVCSFSDDREREPAVWGRSGATVPTGSGSVTGGPPVT